MAFDFQVTIDCSAPHELADWWAETLGWQVEPQDESFIRRMVETGAASEEDTTRHRGALVWKVGAGLTSPDPGRPRVLFQRVPEPRRSRTGCTSTYGWARTDGRPRSPAWSPAVRPSSGAAPRDPTHG